MDKGEEIAKALRDQLLGILNTDVAAVWMYGASVFGHPFIDVDLHVLLHHDHATSPRIWELVEDIHQSLVRRYSIGREDLDFWYILLDDARRAEPPRHLAPWTKGMRDDHWPFHRAHWLAGRVRVIHGLAPGDVVLPPTWQEHETALLQELKGLEDWGATPYSVLQLCRVWASLVTHDVVRSKLDSAEWALRRLDPEYHDIIHAAIRFYRRDGRPEDGTIIAERYGSFRTEVVNQLTT